MLSEPTPSELTLRQLRQHYGLDEPIPVLPYARRPPCVRCGRDVTGHSFFHLPNGVICHVCLGLVRTARVSLKVETRQVKAKRNRWDNYVRPTHNCADCGKTIAETRAMRCRSCAAKQRELALGASLLYLSKPPSR